jgi:hypothetical protein
MSITNVEVNHHVVSVHPLSLCPKYMPPSIYGMPPTVSTFPRSSATRFLRQAASARIVLTAEEKAKMQEQAKEADRRRQLFYPDPEEFVLTPAAADNLRAALDGGAKRMDPARAEEASTVQSCHGRRRRSPRAAAAAAAAAAVPPSIRTGTTKVNDRHSLQSGGKRTAGDWRDEGCGGGGRRGGKRGT